MFNLGATELFFITLIVLLLFGGRRIPELFQGMGKGIRSFRKGLSGDDEKGEEPKKVESSKDSGSEA